VSWYKDAGIKLDALMEQHDIELDSEARDKLITTIDYAIEKMDEKVDSHLMYCRHMLRLAMILWLPVKSASHLRLAAE
jgi:hypothetical protein